VAPSSETHGADGRALPEPHDSTEATDASPDKQSELKLNIGIAAIAAALCFFVAGIFVWMSIVALAVVFGVIGLVTLGIFGRALYRKRRAR